jgi:tetratricopeptide (TPR) repeat protein
VNVIPSGWLAQSPRRKSVSEATRYNKYVTYCPSALGADSDCADTLDNLGHPYTALGQRERARAVWRQALELYRRQGRGEDAERVQRQLDAVGGG